MVVLLSRFNTCPPYFKVESSITRDFVALCSLFTYINSLFSDYNGRTRSREQMARKCTEYVMTASNQITRTCRYNRNRITCL